MISLLIVDDERRAREGIRNAIDWNSHDIHIAGEACDGAEALKILKQFPVDIMITDIRMPVMDGLELIKEVSKLYPSIRNIIYSGYDEFNYAQKAMTFGTCDYLLKPSRPDEILEIVNKQANNINEAKKQSEALDQLRIGFQNSLPLLRERTLSRLVLLSERLPSDRLELMLSLNHITFPKMLFGVLVLEIDDFYTLEQKYDYEEIELFKFAIKNITEEILSRTLVCAAFEHQDTIISILNTDQWIDTLKFQEIMMELQTKVSQYLPLTISIGVGSMDKGISHLHISYLESVNALEKRFLKGSQKIVNYMEKEDIEEATSYPLSEEKAMIQAIISGNREAMVEKFNAFHYALKPESSSKSHVLNSMLALAFSLFHFCIEKNINTDEIFVEDFPKLSKILTSSSIDVIKSVITGIMFRINDHINSSKNNNRIFQEALAYINQNYNKDISRNIVAREVFITPGYLGILFRQQLNMGFLEYLHKIRIDRATELLSNPGIKISEIAYQVGYQDEKYFSQVFRKHTGLTPNQYRNNLPKR
ncbi:response regulator [Paenibacillus oralis]|uniref:Response regulator n=1 Tax=Paenibacillus oralis TaxID=2490856 RepID=A0A3P3U2N8_9BACL|nr:response regulator [Paenibacillus oralis]RRJ64607.1 response regulator [Paenibacillus oralis]